MEKKYTFHGIGTLGLIGVAFMVLKFTGYIKWSWWLVLLPFYGIPSLALSLVLLFLFILIFVKLVIRFFENRRRKKRLSKKDLLHYINIIKVLNGQTADKTTKEKSIYLALKNTKAFKDTAKIATNLPDIKSKVQWIFWEKLKTVLEERDLVVIELKNRSVNSSKTWDYYHKSERNFGLWILIGDYKTYSLCYAITIDHNIFSGFCMLNNLEPIPSPNKEFLRLSSQLIQFDAKYQKSNFWLGWYYVEPKLNFKKFADENIYNLIEEEYLNETVTRIVDSTIEDIRQFKEILDNSK